jgi:IclR family pca regulon transcriptional regulator
MTPRDAPHGERWGTGQSPATNLREPRYSQSLKRGLAILECFTPERPEWGVTELAAEVAASKSTTSRYVMTLTSLGFVRQVAGGRYRATLGITRLGMSTMSGAGLYEHAHDELIELVYEVGHAAAVAVLDGTDAVLIDRVEEKRTGCPRANRAASRGETQPAYCTALGKVLLAFIPAQTQRELLGRLDLLRHASGTITSRRAMRQELAEIADSELALADSEIAEGLLGIAVPVRTFGGEVVAAAGLEAYSSTTSLESMVVLLGPHLQAVANRISARLGYRRAHELSLYANWRAADGCC